MNDQEGPFLQCDNPHCGYIEYVDDITEDMIGYACPKCSQSLLTAEDYAQWRPIWDLIQATKALEDGSADKVMIRTGLHNGVLNFDIETYDPGQAAEELSKKTDVAIALEPQATIPLSVMKWWRELVDLNPQDLAPRMDQIIQRLEDEKLRKKTD